MFDHRGFGAPTLPTPDCSSAGCATFLRLTPVPASVGANRTTPVNNLTGDHATNACGCAYCSKHAALDANAETILGRKTLTNCACSPCSGPTAASAPSDSSTTMAMDNKVDGDLVVVAVSVQGLAKIAEETQKDGMIGEGGKAGGEDSFEEDAAV